MTQASWTDDLELTKDFKVRSQHRMPEERRKLLIDVPKDISRMSEPKDGYSGC